MDTGNIRDTSGIGNVGGRSNVGQTTAPIQINDAGADGGGSSFTQNQLIKMAEWAVEDKLISRGQANQMLQNDGVGPLPEPIDPDSIEGQIDRAMPPARAEDFYVPTGEKPTPEMEQLGQASRKWLSDGRFTREVGNFLIEETDRTAARYSKMNDLEKESYAQQEEVKLRNLWKNDYQKNLNLARAMVAHIERQNPGFEDFVAESGAASNALIIDQLHSQMDILLQRQGNKK